MRNATEKMSDKQLDQLTQAVVAELEKMKAVPTVEQIQDVVEEKLIAADYAKTAKAYILYRGRAPEAPRDGRRAGKDLLRPYLCPG